MSALSTLTQILRSLFYGLGFNLLTRLCPPELLMLGIYLSSFIYSLIATTKTPSSFTEGLIWGLWIEFILAHAAVGVAIARSLATKRLTKILCIVFSSLFYFAFILALVIATNAYWVGVVFLYLTFHRIKEAYQGKSQNLVQEIAVGFAKNMILLLSGGLAIGIAAVLNLGYEYQKFLMWGVGYFTVLYFLIYFLKIDKRI